MMPLNFSLLVLCLLTLSIQIVSVVFRKSKLIVLLQTKECCAWADSHLQFCDGKDWVQMLDKKLNHNTLEIPAGTDCQDVLNRGQSRGDGMYWLDPDGGSHSNAFLAYCDMTSYNGGWIMCHTSGEYANPKTEIKYNSKFPYGTDGYRTNCNNIPFSEIIFVDHETGDKAYFKRRLDPILFKRKTDLIIKAAGNYGKQANTSGLWQGFGAKNGGYSYQLLICDTSFYTGFFVSGFTNCFKQCNNWCGDYKSPYFRTASTSSSYKGVAFNNNGARAVSTRLMSVGLRSAVP